MIFGKSLVNTARQNSFFNFSGIGKLGTQQKVFSHLLRNRRSARRTAAGADFFQITQNRADYTDIVNTWVSIKMFIFCSDKSMFHLIRNFFNRHKQTLFGSVFHHNLTITGKQTGCDRRFIGFELTVIRNCYIDFGHSIGKTNYQNNQKKQSHTG